jgi:hypothetical protein
VILKIVPKAGHECEVYTRGNLPIREKEQFDAAFRESLELIVFLKKQAETYFSLLTRKAKNFKIICPCTKSTD